MREFIKVEFFKFYIKQRLIYVLLIIFALFAMTSYSLSSASNRILERNKDSYNQYMDTLEGYLNDEKIAFIEKENEQFMKLDEQYNKVLKDYKKGTINKAVYIQETKKIHAFKNKSDAFTLVLDSYHEIQDTSKKQALIYANGVENLLVGSFPYLPFLAFLIITVCFFTYENTTEMKNLIQVTKAGKKLIKMSKILLLDGSIVIGFLVFSFIEFFSLFIKFGFCDLSLTYISIPYFQNAPFSFSVLQAYFLTRFLLLLGFLSFFHLIAIIADKSKNVIIPMMSAITLVIISFILRPSIAMKVFITGFFNPQMYIQGNSYGENGEIIFHSINEEVLIILVIISIAWILGSYLYFKNHVSKNKISKVLPLIICVLLCTSCEKKITKDDDFTYNSVNKDVLMLTDKKIYVADNTYQKMIFYNNIKMKYDINRNHFINSLDENNNIKSLFYDGKYVYYSFFTNDQLFFYKMNEDTFKTDLIYTLDYRITSSEFLGLYDSTNKKVINNNYTLPYTFIVKGDTLYYVMMNKVFSVNINTNKTTMIFNNYGSCLSYKNHKLYYINELDQIEFYDLEKGISTKWDELATNLYIDKNEVFYTDLKSEYLYKADLHGNKTHRVLNEMVYTFEVEDEYVYYLKKNEDVIHIFNMQTKEEKKLSTKNLSSFLVNKRNIIYITNDEATNIKRCTIGDGDKYSCDNIN